MNIDDCYGSFKGLKDCKSCDYVKECIESTDLDKPISKSYNFCEYNDEMIQTPILPAKSSSTDIILENFFEEAIYPDKYNPYRHLTMIFKLAGLSDIKVAKLLNKTRVSIWGYSDKIRNQQLKKELAEQTIIFPALANACEAYLRGLE